MYRRQQGTDSRQYGTFDRQTTTNKKIDSKAAPQRSQDSYMQPVYNLSIICCLLL